MVTDGGPPCCPGCGMRLQFGSDRDGRTTESCDCGHLAYMQTRGGQTDQRPALPHIAPGLAAVTPRRSHP